jgi:hypothetical protein
MWVFGAGRGTDRAGSIAHHADDAGRRPAHGTWTLPAPVWRCACAADGDLCRDAQATAEAERRAGALEAAARVLHAEAHPARHALLYALADAAAATATATSHPSTKAGAAVGDALEWRLLPGNHHDATDVAVSEGVPHMHVSHHHAPTSGGGVSAAVLRAPYGRGLVGASSTALASVRAGALALLHAAITILKQPTPPPALAEAAFTVLASRWPRHDLGALCDRSAVLHAVASAASSAANALPMKDDPVYVAGAISRSLPVHTNAGQGHWQGMGGGAGAC